MRYIDTPTLDRLAAIDSPHCVTIAMPVTRSNLDQRDSRLRLENLANQAAEQMLERGVDHEVVTTTLEPVRRWAEDPDFWQERGDGLMIFTWVDSDEPRVFHLDHPVPESVIVADHPDIVPAVNPAAEDNRFALLALSPKRVRVLLGDRAGLDETVIPDLPEDMDAYERLLDEQKSVQHHAVQPPLHRTPHSEGQAQFHGHGSGGDEQLTKLRQQEFARQVDQALTAELARTGLPLVVVASETMWPLYRAVSHYPYLLSKGVTANPDELSSAELHAKAMPLVVEQATPQGATEALRERVAESIGIKGSDHLEEILIAADDGRVDTLLISADDRHWGRYDGHERRVHGPDDPSRRQELIGLAACLTRRGGGHVRVLPRQQIPQRTPTDSAAAALFRY